MKWPRTIGVVDIGILTLIAVALFLPPREMIASSSYPEPTRFALAFAEARTLAYPDNGKYVEDLSRRLGEARYNDWAIEAALDGSERAKESPSRWRALLATSVAYVDRVDAPQALDYANRALAACEIARAKAGPEACADWEGIRIGMYQQALDAGVKSGIDPRQDPSGFRAAGESGIRQIRLKERTGSAPSP